MVFRIISTIILGIYTFALILAFEGADNNEEYGAALIFLFIALTLGFVIVSLWLI